MAQTHPNDFQVALTLLRAALGDVDINKPLSKLMARQRDFGKFEWMLTIIGIEIDLRVDIPEAIADDLTQTAEKFCRRVAELPRVDSPGYTLECLGLVAQALLSLDLTPEDATKSRGTPRARQATAREPKKAAKRAGASRPRAAGGKRAKAPRAAGTKAPRAAGARAPSSRKRP